MDGMIKNSKAELEKKIKEINHQPFKCLPDAEVAASELAKSAEKSLHNINVDITEVPRYGRGRPKKGEIKQPKSIEYKLGVNIEEAAEKIEKLRLEAGCFVLITNVPTQNKDQNWTGEDLLRLYKEQDGIEKNFGFLKDPAIVNAIFLKKPERIEALGLILLLALLLWRLVERDLKLYVKETDTPLPGWKKQLTKNPTSFMMTTKFLSILVITSGKKRKLAKPLTKVQLQYLKALDIKPECFISP
ncbi:IS1634 family transposase [Desulfobacter latus]|uniref:IS1634 family transposase n=1 Tax=Desulfobacter latus TaxID=2292 RepID=A0A850T496_9BACT|nr:IS1634 family transposase [Desulfobacter latus]